MKGSVYFSRQFDQEKIHLDHKKYESKVLPKIPPIPRETKLPDSRALSP